MKDDSAGQLINILLVEDNPGDARLVREMLGEAKKGFFKLDCCDRLSAGLRHLSQMETHLILLDLFLPDSQGYDTLLRITQEAPRAPIILLTSLDDDELAIKAIQNGAQDYLVKSEVNTEILIRSIRYALERKHTEEALRESERRYRQLFENVPAGLYRTTRNGEIVDANPAMLQMLGYPNMESLKAMKAIGTYVNREDRIRWQKIMNRDGIVRNYQKRLRQRDGTIIWVEENAQTFSDSGGEQYYEGTMIDITERKQAEEALRKSEEKFRELFDNAPVGYHECDVAGRITSVNRTELEMLGYTVEEMVGKFIWSFIAEEEKSRQTVMGKLADVLPPSRGIERTYHRKDGTTFPALIQDQLLRDEKGRVTGIRSTIQDITGRKRAEKEMVELQEQFRQSQKIEAIGQLAGGVAHDFNNLLTVIKGICQLSLLDLKEADPLYSNLKEIERSAEKAANLTRQLLAFSRKQILEMKVLDLNDLIKNLEKMLHRLLGEDIELATFFTEGIGRVKVDPGQMEQVIINLAVNARDAMVQGGKLTIETANVELDEEYARRHVSVKPGHYVMLSISDTGMGMTPEVKERIFEPFFTTKGMGKGTGLGLSTVYGIVKQSGGNIWVYSEPGQGTAFKIYLPRVDEPPEEIREVVIKEVPQGSETILVVEDDEMVRKLAVRLLKKQGYKVLEAEDGRRALMLCRESKESIHLVLSDVVLPGMSGRKLVEQLKEIYPESKTLYMSGYTDNVIQHHGILERGIEFIQKPFTMESLARKVREVLDKA